MLVNTMVPLQPVLWGNTVKVIVPVGCEPPDSVAVSDAEPADVMLEGETVVVMLGLAGWTVSVSPLSPQGAVNGLLFESPLYDAIQRYVPA